MVQISKMFRLERHFFLIRPNFTEFLQFSREELKIRFGMSSILNKNPYRNVFEIDELLKNNFIIFRIPSFFVIKENRQKNKFDIIWNFRFNFLLIFLQKLAGTLLDN